MAHGNSCRTLLLTEEGPQFWWRRSGFIGQRDASFDIVKFSNLSYDSVFFLLPFVPISGIYYFS